jgi:hypothetical protein
MVAAVLIWESPIHLHRELKKKKVRVYSYDELSVDNRSQICFAYLLHNVRAGGASIRASVPTGWPCILRGWQGTCRVGGGHPFRAVSVGTVRVAVPALHR